MTTICASAYYGRVGLTDVYIPATIECIEPNPFINCPDIETFTVDENNPNYYVEGNCIIERATRMLISGCKNSVIPKDGSVTGIAEFAFMGCTGLKSMSVPGTVTSIGDCAFFGCENLDAIAVPKSVLQLGESALQTLGIKDVTIYTEKGSRGEEYADDHGCKLRLFDSDFFE